MARLGPPPMREQFYGFIIVGPAPPQIQLWEETGAAFPTTY